MQSYFNAVKSSITGPHFFWVFFYGSVLVAWWLLVAMAADMPGFGIMHFTAPQLWEALCLSAAEADPFALFGMWAVMSVAMMFPTFVPSLRTYLDLRNTGAGSEMGAVALVLGYAIVWIGFSVIAAALQVVLDGFGLVGQDGSSLSVFLTIFLLVCAGLYQFSDFKEACLSRCRAPLTFFLERWAPGNRAAFSMGLQLGGHCLGCCWALMLLGFVGGTMNIIWMGLATVFMVAEKLPEVGRYLTRPMGYLLLAGALFVLLRAVGLM